VPAPVVPAPVAPAQSFVSPKGRTYRVIDTGDRGEFVEPAPMLGVGGAAPEDDFVGRDRKAAKTSIATGPMESFANVSDLLRSLVRDKKMRALNPPISKDEMSDRVEQEMRNVAVHGYIYAVKFESDHDYHVILGMSEDDPVDAYLNVEVSGLPQGGAHRAKLKQARDAFKQHFQAADVRFGSSYKKFDPPIPVRLEGSLFFDVDHKAGVVGPQGMRPKTSWEIHPVTRIEFDIEP
jgi:hypothetical protein